VTGVEGEILPAERNIEPNVEPNVKCPGEAERKMLGAKRKRSTVFKSNPEKTRFSKLGCYGDCYRFIRQD
jgi:hypothetical protein